MSGAITRYPASANPVSWWRQEYQDSGQPWINNTNGPLPASAIRMEIPLD